MPLHRIKDFDPDYRSHFSEHDVKGLDFYAGDEKVGSVDDILVDDEGQFRYLIVNTGLWILGKKVLFPIGRARIDYDANRVYADNLTKAQVESLPEFMDDIIVDHEYEEQVRGVYRSSRFTPQHETSAEHGVGHGGANYDAGVLQAEALAFESEAANYDSQSYTYDQEPDLYALNEQSHPSLKLYQERLVTSKTRQRAGDTVISKRIETETALASIDVDKERVVVERIPVTDRAVAPGEAQFQAGEVSRIEVYEEVPDFHKEAFVREEVRVSKVVDQETATAEENLRREELDVSIEGTPVGERQR
jgi:uncharacterized protein (TIGR02271 family)